MTQMTQMTQMAQMRPGARVPDRRAGRRPASAGRAGICVICVIRGLHFLRDTDMEGSGLR
jgi:hypothetical protein